MKCKHKNSISVYDTTCHVILGEWYCTDCKQVYPESNTDKIGEEK